MKLYEISWKKRNIQLVKYAQDISLDEYIALCETPDHTSKIMVEAGTGNLLTGFTFKTDNSQRYFVTF